MYRFLHCKKLFLLFAISTSLLLTTWSVSASPPTDVYYYTQLSWTVNAKQDFHVANYMAFHRDAPRYAIDAINRNPDILPNTTIHYVVEDHLNNPHYAVDLLNDFISSAAYPVVMFYIDALFEPVVQFTAFQANTYGLLAGTVFNAMHEFSNTELYPNFLRCVSGFSFLSLISLSSLVYWVDFVVFCCLYSVPLSVCSLSPLVLHSAFFYFLTLYPSPLPSIPPIP